MGQGGGERIQGYFVYKINKSYIKIVIIVWVI